MMTQGKGGGEGEREEDGGEVVAIEKGGGLVNL